jgi:hypothetical protein
MVSKMSAVKLGLFVALLGTQISLSHSTCAAGYVSVMMEQPVLCGGTCLCNGILEKGHPISSMLGDDYQNNADCWWIISGVNPSITFSRFAVVFYIQGDEVIIDQSADLSFFLSEVLHMVTLRGQLGQGMADTYTATEKYLRIRFTSDYSGVAQGFRATFSGSLESCIESSAEKMESLSGEEISSSENNLFTCKSSDTGNCESVFDK